MVCTEPLPNVFLPTSIPLLLSCIAPESISLALAEPSLTNTAMGLLINALPLALLTSVIEFLVFVLTLYIYVHLWYSQ